MQTILFYISCYWISFMLGSLIATVVIYYVMEQKNRKHRIIEKRIKQLRRDAQCRGTIG